MAFSTHSLSMCGAHGFTKIHKVFSLTGIVDSLQVKDCYFYSYLARLSFALGSKHECPLTDRSTLVNVTFIVKIIVSFHSLVSGSLSPNHETTNSEETFLFAGNCDFVLLFGCFWSL